MYRSVWVAICDSTGVGKSSSHCYGPTIHNGHRRWYQVRVIAPAWLPSCQYDRGRKRATKNPDGQATGFCTALAASSGVTKVFPRNSCPRMLAVPHKSDVADRRDMRGRVKTTDFPHVGCGCTAKVKIAASDPSVGKSCGVGHDEFSKKRASPAIILPPSGWPTRSLQGGCH